MLWNNHLPIWDVDYLERQKYYVTDVVWFWHQCGSDMIKGGVSCSVTCGWWQFWFSAHSSFSLLSSVIYVLLFFVFKYIFTNFHYITPCCCTFFIWHKVIWSFFLLSSTEFMFITEEILSGVCTRVRYSSVSHFLVQSGPVRRCFQCVCVHLRAIIFHIASFLPCFSFISYQNSSACLLR